MKVTIYNRARLWEFGKNEAYIATILVSPCKRINTLKRNVAKAIKAMREGDRDNGVIRFYYCQVEPTKEHPFGVVFEF